MQTWQQLLLSSGPGTTFFEFCDALEVESDGEVAGPSGWGLDHALAAWGSYYEESFIQTREYDSDFKRCSRCMVLRLMMRLQTVVPLTARE